MRLAAVAGVRRGVQIDAVIHDAFLIESDADELEDAVTAMQAAMAFASNKVLAVWSSRRTSTGSAGPIGTWIPDRPPKGCGTSRRESWPNWRRSGWVPTSTLLPDRSTCFYPRANRSRVQTTPGSSYSLSYYGRSWGVVSQCVSPASSY
jgi:hypothetical protein